MRIAHVVSTYPPYRAGMGNVAEAYVEGLRRRGHQVAVFSLGNLWSFLRAGNAGQVPQLLWRLRGFDLVHLHYPFFGGAEWVALAKHLGIVKQLVITYHMDARPSGWMAWVFRAYDVILRRWILRQADVILGAAESYMQTSAVARDPVAFAKVHILPFGIDPQRFHPGVDSELRRAHGITPGTPILIFIGAMDRAHPFKGLPTLFAALETLLDLPWTLVLIGDGDQRPGYERQVSGWESGRVQFLGGVDDANKERWLRSVDIHLSPSTSRAEAFGIAALEAMASGLPTIASNLPGVRDLVRHKETGLLVPPNNPRELAAAMERLLCHSEERRAFADAALQRSRAYHQDLLLDQLEAVYRQCVV